MFAFETSLLIPLGDNVFCIVCLLCVLPPEVDQQRKSLHNCSTRPESKVNSYPVFCAFFCQCSLPPLSCHFCYLKRKENTLISVLLLFCCLPAVVSLILTGPSLSLSRSALLKVITLPNTPSSVTACVIGPVVSQSVKTSASLSSRFKQSSHF